MMITDFGVECHRHLFTVVVIYVGLCSLIDLSAMVLSSRMDSDHLLIKVDAVAKGLNAIPKE